MSDPVLYMGAAEVCAYLNVARSTLGRWRQRRAFPEPIVVLAATPVWDADEIRDFAHNRALKAANPPH